MSLSVAQADSLRAARNYVDFALMITLLAAFIGSLSLGVAIASDNAGVFASSIIVLMVAVWGDRMRRSYRLEIKDLQDTDAANDIFAPINQIPNPPVNP